MNIRRGLWRTWIFLSVLWIIGTLTLACFILPDSLAQRYQYVYMMKKEAGDPNKVDWTKDFYALMRSPSEEKLPTTFEILTYQYFANWDEDVKKGKMITVDFPDKSRLYLSAQMTKDDQNYVSKTSWDQRWERWGTEALRWGAGAVVPPFILLLLGSFMVWVGRGFARD